MEHKPYQAIDEAYRRAIKALREMRSASRSVGCLPDAELDSVQLLDKNTQVGAHRAFITEMLEAFEKSYHQHFGRTWPW